MHSLYSLFVENSPRPGALAATKPGKNQTKCQKITIMKKRSGTRRAIRGTDKVRSSKIAKSSVSNAKISRKSKFGVSKNRIKITTGKIKAPRLQKAS